MTMKDAWLIVSVCMTAGLVLGGISGYIIGMMFGTDKERARCLWVVAGRLCAGHFPKREFRQRLNEPCGLCDPVAESMDYIQIGLTPKDPRESKERKAGG